jgi:fluoroacetyl-CoA thioesterase
VADPTDSDRVPGPPPGKPTNPPTGTPPGTPTGPPPGSPTGTVTTTVTSGDTARALGSGDVDVLGTPRVLALVEAATVRASAPLLADGETTVGTRVELDHLASSPVGATVRADAELVDRTGRRLTFHVRLTQDGRTVATGRVIRAVVDRDRFTGAAQASTDDRG